MATRTGSLVHRIIAMGLFKGGFAAVMATEAKGSLRLNQEVFLVRTVGRVASCTTFLPHFMEYFLFIILFLMALIASFVTLCFQQVAGLRGMGIMALNAFPSLQGRMDTRLYSSLFYLYCGMDSRFHFLLSSEAVWALNRAGDGNPRISFL